MSPSCVAWADAGQCHFSNGGLGRCSGIRAPSLQGMALSFPPCPSAAARGLCWTPLFCRAFWTQPMAAGSSGRTGVIPLLGAGQGGFAALGKDRKHPGSGASRDAPWHPCSCRVRNSLCLSLGSLGSAATITSVLTTDLFLSSHHWERGIPLSAL